MAKKLLLIKPPLWTNPGSPPLELGIVAALTPGHWEVEIIDTFFQSFKNKDADLVGLTATTPNVSSAYKISGYFRDKGIPTVLGGIHASLMPEEALQYVDTVVIGEAEAIWADVIADFENGKLKKKYLGKPTDLKQVPMPRYDLFLPYYMAGRIETSRGCPFDCDFCYLSGYVSHQYRQRPLEDVLDELETIPQKLIYIVDNNLYGYGSKAAQRAIALFKGIINRGIRKNWNALVSINFCENQEVLEYAAKSGCGSVCIGVEAENPHALAEMNKTYNLKVLDTYKDAFQRLKQHGISAQGAFIFGMDNDTPENVRQRCDFILNSGLDCAWIYFLTPFPGTPLLKKMLAEDRLLYTNFPGDWDHYNFWEVVYQPLLMTPQELQELVFENWRRVYNPFTAGGRLIKTFYERSTIRSFVPIFAASLYQLTWTFGLQTREWLKRFMLPV